jgi:hypothetical protein
VKQFERKMVNVLFFYKYFTDSFYFFADRTVHSAMDIVPVDRAGQRSRAGGLIVQQSSQEPHELFHHAPCAGRQVFFFVFLFLLRFRPTYIII